MGERATWSVSIITTCPHCGDIVDLADAPDFWTDGLGSGLTLAQDGEHEARCPECDEDFTVVLEW